MESVGSNSPSPAATYDPAQQITDRVIRALTHRLALLHRSEPGKFHVLGATGNVYTVALTPTTSPSCTCPDRVSPCKHLLFVLLRVLGLPLDDPVVYNRRPLRPCQLERAVSMPTAAGVMAGARAVERFHEMVANDGAMTGEERGRGRREGETCPVCLEEMMMGDDNEVATCGTCGNSVHGECLRRWKRSRGRRAASCVVCRARWRERRDVKRYVNLRGYAEDGEGGEGGWGMCAR